MSKWMSRKLFVAVGSVVTTLLVQGLGFPEAVAAQLTDGVVWIATAYIGGQGLVDGASALKK